MAEKTTVTLVHPDGKRKYETTDAAEVTNLKARGYTEDKPKVSSSKS